VYVRPSRYLESSFTFEDARFAVQTAPPALSRAVRSRPALSKMRPEGTLSKPRSSAASALHELRASRAGIWRRCRGKFGSSANTGICQNPSCCRNTERSKTWHKIEALDKQHKPRARRATGVLRRQRRMARAVPRADAEGQGRGAAPRLRAIAAARPAAARDSGTWRSGGFFAPRGGVPRWSSRGHFLASRFVKRSARGSHPPEPLLILVSRCPSKAQISEGLGPIFPD
jgi:hypothetical protein